MPRYYFDVCEGDHFVPDDVGLVLPNLETARDQATRALAEIARDTLPGTVQREIAIEVKDHARAPLLRAGLSFELRKLA
ncbi:MAG TPA: hypothetical protein VHN20_08960 [Beijerinckiaceae bacterium]|nr:hypothetical protein [Beijerinckiaceae bacterium]